MITCTFEDDGKANLRHVVTDVIVVDESNRILLVRRAPHLVQGNKFGVVGGYVGLNETIVQAAMREVVEETGYKTSIQYLFGIIDRPDRLNDERQNISFVYVAKVLEKVGDPDQESTEVTWFLLDNLPHPSEFAFDHFRIIQKYMEYSQKKYAIPVMSLTGGCS